MLSNLNFIISVICNKLNLLHCNEEHLVVKRRVT
jgi:hypothetical protein